MNYNDSLTPVDNFLAIFSHILTENPNGDTEHRNFIGSGHEVILNNADCEYGRFKGITVLEATSGERNAYFEIVYSNDECRDSLSEEPDFLEFSELNSDNEHCLLALFGAGFDAESACRNVFSAVGEVA